MNLHPTQYTALARLADWGVPVLGASGVSCALPRTPLSVDLFDPCPEPPVGLRALPLRDSYRTGDDDLVQAFFAPCLGAATSYDRAVGYFRSSVFVVAGPALIDFARRGGLLRLVCSPELHEEDAAAMAEGYDGRREVLARALVRDVAHLLGLERLRTHTAALATLVETGAMDVRIAFRPSGAGIYHEKLGVFADGEGASVSFRGSSNETFRAWDAGGNAEAFDVFCSWRPGDERRVADHASIFERLWAGGDGGVETVAFPDVARERLRTVAYADLEEARERLAELEAAQPTVTMPARRRRGVRVPLPHQERGLAAWRANGRRGILKHATGSGKTFTALVAIDEHLGEDGAALVLVPSALLLQQWADEVKRTLGGVTMLLAGDGNDGWRLPDRLETFTEAPEGLGRRVVLATMATASKAEFLRRVRTGDHLLVVADEVHRTGSARQRAVLGLDAGARLGLSATPERYGDEEGTAALMAYFGGVVPPPFTLADAIAAGRLVPYEYYPHVVRLTAEEEATWADFTKRISREVAILNGPKSGRPPASPRSSDELKRLLIQRARVVKKAAAKVVLAAEVLASYRENQRWLVYCEDTAQLRAVSDRLRADGLPVSEYFTRMDGDEAATLEWFRRFGGVLVAIRCLDEGVDIPQASHALILASSQNPREFIQRRGRVLRVAPAAAEKHVAVIHDALVVPAGVAEDLDFTSVTKTELRRAAEFAEHAVNGAARLDLLALAIRLGVDLDADGAAEEVDEADDEA